MPKDRNAFKAGLFIVISIVLILAVIVAIKGAGQFIEPEQIRLATFALEDDVSGLRIGDDVRVGGLKVGIIRSIDVVTGDKPGGEHVLIRFNLPRRFTVREGARLSVQSTLTGGAWLNFENLGAGKELAQDTSLKGLPSTFATLAKSLNALGPEIQGLAADIRTVTLPKVNTTADNASATLAQIKERLDGIIDRYNGVTERLSSALEHLRDILGEGKGDIRGTLSNLNSATGTLKEQLPRVLENFDKLVSNINRELESTEGALADIRATIGNAKDATGAINSLLVANRGKLDSIVQSLKVSGDNLKAATAEIRHSPWRLLYKPKANEMANLNLYDATRQFADGATELSTAATSLRDALKDPQADQPKIQGLVERLDETFGEFQKVESDLWQRVQEK